MTTLRHPRTGATVDDNNLTEARLAKLTALGYRPVKAGGAKPAKKPPAKKAADKSVTAVKRPSTES